MYTPTHENSSAHMVGGEGCGGRQHLWQESRYREEGDREGRKGERKGEQRSKRPREIKRDTRNKKRESVESERRKRGIELGGRIKRKQMEGK